MQWQDVVIASMYVPFNLALLPSIMSKNNKPALSTSLITAVCNGVIAFVQITLGLYFAAFATAINSALWLTLAYQKKKSL